MKIIANSWKYDLNERILKTLSNVCSAITIRRLYKRSHNFHLKMIRGYYRGLKLQCTGKNKQTNKTMIRTFQ